MSTLPDFVPAEAAPDLDFRVLVEAASDIVAVTDLETTIRYVSGSVERILGLRPAQLVGRRVRELLSPEAVAELERRLAPVVAGQPPRGDPHTYEFVAGDGTARYLEVVATDLRSNPRVAGLCVVARDVTDRVLRERERASQRERQALAARVARVGIWEWELESQAMFASNAARMLLRQHEGQQWDGPESFLDRFVPEDRPALAAAMQRAVHDGLPAECTVRLALSGGDVRWLHIYGQRNVSSLGKPRVLGLVMDVTAQKRAERELAERRDTLALASEASGLCVWVWQPLEDRLDLDERFAAWAGLPAGKTSLTFAQWQALLHPDDLQAMTDEGADLSEGRRDVFDSTYRLRRPDGGWRWILDRGRVAERDAEGRATRIYGIAIDIDERKRHETALAEQRLRLRLALDSARLGLWDWDRQARRLVVDERFCEIVGDPIDAFSDEPFLLERRLRAEDRERVREAIRACIHGATSEYRVHGRLLRRDGKASDVLMQGAVSERDRDGRPTRLTGLLADVTETERARQLARISEEVAAVGSYEIDLATNGIAWSEGTYRIFGMPDSYRPDTESTLQLVSPASRERMRRAFQAARVSAAPFDTEFEVHRLDGASAWIRMIGRVDTFEGRPVRLYGIVQDVSARKRLERELLEVANREQQRLGSELHDGLGQGLAGMSMMLEAMAQQLAGSRPAMRAQFERLRELVTHSIQDTRALAHGLAPVSLQRGGLEGALRRLAEQFDAAGKVSVELDLDLQAPLALDEVAGNHLYRIAQEAVANAIRHGRARRVAIAFCSAPGVVTLAVEDDGGGMPAGGAATEGFGLRSMRYRAEALEGSLVVGPGEDGGTRVLVRCPQPNR